MAEEGEEGDKGRVPPTTSAMTASRSSRSLLIKPLSKLDHLGLPLSSSNNQKFKYARTCTIIFDQEKARDLKEEKQWVLLKDTKVVMDMSTAGLKRLFSLFKEASRGMGVGDSMIGPRAFSLALRQMGLRDPVHIDRLFKNFNHPNQPEKIDFREYMRTLCSVNEEPIEDRLRLLFDVWDVDHSGSLSYSELGIIIVTGVDSGDLDTVTEAFNRVWSEIRSQSQNKEEDWIGPGRAAGISKEDLVESVRRPGFVRDFFIQQLTRQAPARGGQRAARGRKIAPTPPQKNTTPPPHPPPPPPPPAPGGSRASTSSRTGSSSRSGTRACARPNATKCLNTVLRCGTAPIASTCAKWAW